MKIMIITISNFLKAKHSGEPLDNQTLYTNG